MLFFIYDKHFACLFLGGIDMNTHEWLIVGMDKTKWFITWVENSVWITFYHSPFLYNYEMYTKGNRR